jgi:molecular chaperone IbpA
MKTTMLDPIYQTMIGFESMLNKATSTYPPYNLYKDDEHYVIEIAVSGWSRDELDVSMTGTTLTIKGTKTDEQDNRQYLVRGLAHRSWTRTWTLEPDISVSHVVLEDGVLYIELTQTQGRTTRKIDIH